MLAGLFFRIVIALTALGLFAARIWWPGLQIDMTALALLAVAMIVLFGRNIRIKTLDLMGFKVEFDQASSQKPSDAASAQQPVGSAGPSLQPNSYFAQVAKLTPSEMIAAYLMIITMLKTSPNISATIGIVIFVFFLVACFVFYYRVLGTGAWSQATLMTLSFAAWAYALEFPFSSLGWYSPAIASLTLALVLFAMPVLYPAVQVGFGQQDR